MSILSGVIYLIVALLINVLLILDTISNAATILSFLFYNTIILYPSEMWSMITDQVT